MVIASSTIHAAAMVERRIEGGLAVTLSENITVTEDSPMEDFVLYKFLTRMASLYCLPISATFRRESMHRPKQGSRNPLSQASTL